ncbi:MAG: hypothetical protein NC203_04170 [Firmicutes bacterium]|nr:hypothetical protein [[Eubacterium] siraeum]MCM1487545.1 hypothetical protein [Bacillota bacterium]
MSYKVKNFLSIIFIGVSVLMLSSCQNNTPAEISDSKISDTISFTKDMGEYSVNVSLPVSQCGELEDYYDVEFKEDNVYIADTKGNKVSGMTLNNPAVGGTHPGLKDLNLKFDVIELESGNLFAVRFPYPLKNAPSAYALTLYYFDGGFINYIGETENGGDFFPFITGDIQADGDDIILTETDADGVDLQARYSVDFDKKLLVKQSE